MVTFRRGWWWSVVVGGVVERGGRWCGGAWWSVVWWSPGCRWWSVVWWSVVVGGAVESRAPLAPVVVGGQRSRRSELS
ncbi:hypothetical protein CXF30_04685 [Corynebacterium bovis]|nr:hypothetical protein CXF30_04685 [Corynebacterium bovis]